jgi:hypothetical protein
MPRVGLLCKMATLATVLAAAVLLLLTLNTPATAKKGPRVTEVVFFDIEQGGEDLGRIEIGLFGDSVNKTVTNFRELAKRVSRSRDAAVGVVRESWDTCFILCLLGHVVSCSM